MKTTRHALVRLGNERKHVEGIADDDLHQHDECCDPAKLKGSASALCC